GLATLVAVSTVGLAGEPAAAASTPRFKPAETIVCNNSTMPCTNISNLMLNQGNGPDFIQNASGWGVVPPSLYQGRKINLRQASHTRFTEGFTIPTAAPAGALERPPA